MINIIKDKKHLRFFGIFLFIAVIISAVKFIPNLTSGKILTETKPALANVIDNQTIVKSDPSFIFLPLIQREHNNPEKFFGIIMPVYWTKENVRTYMPEADLLAGGKKHSAVSWGIDIQDPALYEPWESDSELNRNNLYRQLEQLWLEGYISFVKIGSSSTISQIDDGEYDNQLNQMAQIYKRWLDNGEGRIAMFAPFQEMNGEWVPYYSEEENAYQRQQNFKEAYYHIQNVFSDNGVDRSQIWWVFSPNGGSLPEDNFEYYYPGDEFVDLVGFAAYNFGYCPATVKPDGNNYGNWENYERIFEPYINRFQEMAPSKYILISETGTSALTSNEAREDSLYDYEKKAEWLTLNYGWLANQPKVLGIFYFDFNDLGNDVTCDLGIPRTDFNGYQNAVENPAFKYLTANNLQSIIQ